ncbi:MAG: hypothetical protein K2X69_01100, partial [Silvanigrellaceae bacterium]|nr:hypothetical protein [Silvanigrellaceae bacterium]
MNPKNKIFSLFSLLLIASCGEKLQKDPETYEKRKLNYSSSSCGNVEVDFNEIFDQSHFEGKTSPEIANEIAISYRKLESYVRISDLANNMISEILFTEELIKNIDNLIYAIEKLPKNTNSALFKNLMDLKNAIQKTKQEKMQSSNAEYVKALRVREKTSNTLKTFLKLNEKIMNEHSISREEYTPLLIGQNEEKKSITFLNMKDQTTLNVIVEDPLFHSFSKASHEIKNILNGAEYSGINKGFAIQALADTFLHYKKSPTVYPIYTNLEKMLLAQYYLGMAQITIGVVEEFEFIANVIKTLSTSGASFGELGVGLFSRAGAGLNFLLMLINVGLDSAEIASAVSFKDKEIYGAKLGFDLAGLGLAGGALIFPELGPLGVPFAGIAFAGSMLAERIATLTDITFQYGKEFDKIKNDYLYDVKQFMSKSIIDENTYLSFSYNFSSGSPEHNRSVIETIDMSKPKKINIKFGNNFILKTVNTEYRNKNNNYNCFFCKNPSEKIGEYHFDHNEVSQDDYLGIRELLNIPDFKEIDLSSETYQPLYQNGIHIMLPINPKSYFWYEYGASKGILNQYYRDNAPTVFEMQDNSNGQFFFGFGEPIIDQGISKMKMRFEPTDVKLLLGNEAVNIFTPNIPDIWLNKLKYYLEGSEGGRYNLFPKKGAQYYISGTGSETFNIIIDQNSKYSLDNIK